MKKFSNFAYAIGLLMMVPAPGAPTQAASVESGQIIGLASSTFTDVGYFCARKPAFCQAAADLALAVEANAKSNFQLLRSWASETVEYKMFTLPPSLATAMTDGVAIDGFRPTIDD